MTKQLYEEALADVKKLKEVAEDNAKRALLEAVTPRIRDLIENQLLGEMNVEELEAKPENILKDDPEEGGAKKSSSSEKEPEDKKDGSDEKAVEMNSESITFESKIQHLQSKVKLFEGSSPLLRETRQFTNALSSLISEVEDTYSYLQNSLQDSPKKDSYESVLENYYSTLKQLMEQKMKNKKTLSEADLTLKLTGLPDDVEDALESIGVDLITGEEGEEGEEGAEDELDLGGDEGEEEGGEGEEGDEGEDDLGLDLGSDEEGSDEEENKMESRRLSDDTIVEIDEAMLRREIGRMKALREEADMPKLAPKGHGPGEVADGFEDDDLGDPFEDGEVTTEGDMAHEAMGVDEKEDPMGETYGEADVNEMMDEMDEMDEVDEAYGEADDPREMHGNVASQGMGRGAADQKQSRQPGYTVESIRKALASEAQIQLEAKKKASKAKKLHREQQAQEKKSNTPAKKQQAKQNQAKIKEAYNFYATKFNESVARTNKLKGMLVEATRKGAVLNGGAKKSAVETDLRNKLAETNLFNAKLLFTNKLLQNESLTKRQKAEVIERLDEAKNEREVKLVYESLVKTLAGTPSKITESADRGVIGSSSRPARPASATNTLNEGFEADRWARLAGIVK